MILILGLACSRGDGEAAEEELWAPGPQGSNTVLILLTWAASLLMCCRTSSLRSLPPMMLNSSYTRLNRFFQLPLLSMAFFRIVRSTPLVEWKISLTNCAQKLKWMMFLYLLAMLNSWRRDALHRMESSPIRPRTTSIVLIVDSLMKTLRSDDRRRASSSSPVQSASSPAILSWMCLLCFLECVLADSRSRSSLKASCCQRLSVWCPNHGTEREGV
mmetsp:Transcript_12905/g.36171  ORF Transcript_12905/g.36171 Transcript_12905/m.36171 type:complete len:216 (+) Transcript_12905:1514-2161(+)